MNMVTKEILQALCVSEWLTGQMVPAPDSFTSGYQTFHQLKSMSFQCPKRQKGDYKVCIEMFQTNTCI